MSGLSQTRRCGESDDEPTGELVFREPAGTETVLASADGDGDRAELRRVLQALEFDGRADRPNPFTRRYQLVISVLGTTTRTGPLSRKAAIALENRLVGPDGGVEGMSVERVGYNTEKGDGRVE